MKKLLFLLLALALLGTGALAGMRLAQEEPVLALREQLGLGLSEAGEAQISVYTEGRLSEAALRDVKRAAGAFNELAKESMGAGLRQPVKLYVAGTERDYEKVLAREFELPEAEARQIASISGGWSGGGRRLTAVNAGAGVMSGTSERTSTTVHELFHQLQYELSKGHDTDEEALFWLEEGTADYLGAVAAEKLGGKSLAKWQLDTQMDVLLAHKPVAPEKLLHCTAKDRMALMGKEYHSYQVADVLTCYLLNRLSEPQRLPAIAAYFRALSDGGGGEVAFERAFGIDLQAFLQEYHVWWAHFQQAPAAWQYLAEAGVPEERQSLLAAQVEKTQAELADKLGAGYQIHGAYQVVLTADEEGLAEAARKYCEMEAGRAEQLSANSLGIENGSTLLVNTARLDDEQQRTLSLSVLLLRTLEGQYLGRGESRSDIAWLAKGAAYVFGIDVYLEKIGSRPADYYRNLSRQQRSRSMPEISFLRSEDDYNRLAEIYGAENLSNLTELAAYELIRRYGWGAFGRWLSETRRQQDAEQAFRAVYGQSSSNFADEFQRQLLR